MDDASETFDRITELANTLGDEILSRASSSENAFRLIRIAAVTLQVHVGLGTTKPEFRERINALQADKMRNQFDELGIDPEPISAHACRSRT